MGSGCESASIINDVTAVLLVLVQGNLWAFCDIIETLEKKGTNKFCT